MKINTGCFLNGCKCFDPEDEDGVGVKPDREWQGLIKGVRVDGCNVVIFAGNNDAARDLCGILLKEKEI